MELRHLKPSTVQAWVRSRQTEVAPSYCRLLLSNLSTILSAAVEDGDPVEPLRRHLGEGSSGGPAPCGALVC